MAQNAKEAMLAFVRTQGWIPDANVTKPKSKSRYGSSDERVQHPHAFVKPAAHGGTWHILLDYQNNSGYSRGFDNVLRGISIVHRDDEGKATYQTRMKNTDNRASYNRPNDLWDAMRTNDGDNMRSRAMKVVGNIDLAVWLGAALAYDRKVAERARWDAEERDREEKAKLPQHVVVEDYQWHSLRYEFKSAARAVYEANGKTDIVAAIYEAQAKLDAIVDAVDMPNKVNLAEMVKA